MLQGMRGHSLFPRVRRLRQNGLLILILFNGGLGWTQTLSDNFSSYFPESDAGPTWEPQAAGWTVIDGGYHGEEGASVWRAAPWAASARFACDVTVVEPLTGDWLTAGIGLQVDDRDYWALNLVAAPEGQQRRHSTEMQEMLQGVWLAQSQTSNHLEQLPSHGADFKWRLGQTYRLELELTTSNIIGRISQGTEEVSRFGYRLDSPSPAVRLGRPMLRASGLKVRFGNATVTVDKTAAAPPVEAKRIVPWLSRPGKSLTKGSGFFRTLQIDGRWWLVDSEGKPFFDVGTDHASYQGHWCEALGYAPYNRNVAAKYGSEAAWGEATLERLKSWGFNCLPAGHSPSLRHRGLAHIEFASFGSSFARREWICKPVNWTGFPDVFSPRWESHCRLVARRMAQEAKSDPWCIGTFLDNELEWYGKSGHLVDEVFQLAPQQPAKKALYKWLMERFNSLAEINRQLSTKYVDEASFLNTTNVPPPLPGLEQARDQFLAVIAERYFGVAAKALREADPEHLVLGCRFAGQAPKAVLAAAGKYNDVFTLNTYPQVDFENTWQPDGTGGVVEGVPRQVADYYEVVQKPMIITEWSFPALDSGLPCKHGAGMRVDTQEQKADCYRIFANMVAESPFMVGYHYFMWADEPVMGISSAFPEDSNYGLVNEKDEPYALFIKTAAEVNAQVAQRHERSRFSGLMVLAAGPNRVEVQNTNAVEAHGHLRLTDQGRSRVEEVLLKPGERRQVQMPPDTVWCAELQNWDGGKQRVLGGKLRPEAFTLLNASSQELTRVPVVLERPGLVFGTVQTLAPGQSIGLNARALKLEKRNEVELQGADTTWISTGKTGALFDRIESRGLSLGQLVFAVHQKVNGQDAWVESTRVIGLEMEEQPDAWVLEAEVDNPAALNGPAGYRARVRAVVFKQLGFALVRPIWVESVDSRSWQLMEAYWFCRSAIGGSADHDIVGGPEVPGYYRPAQFITDSKLGGCFGSLGQAPGWQVMFWTNPQGGIHPDSRFAVSQEMHSGKRWQAERVPFLWVYGSNRTKAWKEFSRLNQQSRNVVIRAATAGTE